MTVDLGTTWNTALATEFEQPYFCDLLRAVDLAYQTRTVFPSQETIFRAFHLCPLPEVKVVLLGQDPYHGAGQAHGLSFSVPDTTKIPPTLRNIYKEITTDTGTLTSESGNLECWATQGVLLLNSTLTVEEAQPGFHQGWGWEQFTDKVIEVISDQQEHVVFLLWGKYAQAKAPLIDETKHLILTTSHPSPLSAHRGFFGCKHFSQTNTYLKQHQLPPIVW